MTHVDANRDGDQLTVLAKNDEETVALLATVDADATHAEILELIAEVDRELEIGSTLLQSDRAAEQPVREARADGGEV